MNAFFVSTLAIASAEMGDKTQLLAFIFATRYQRPLLIIISIFIATLMNHAIAVTAGIWLSSILLKGTIAHLILGASFLFAAIWILIPDKTPLSEQGTEKSNALFLTITLTFFLAEMGDKTQVATALLAARFEIWLPILLGTTCGMLVANIPVILLGKKIKDYISFRLLRYLSFSIFFILGMHELIELCV